MDLITDCIMKMRGGMLVLSLVSIGMSLGVPSISQSKSDSAWSRGLNLSAPVNPHFEPFEIRGIRSEQGNHLVGEFWYFNYKEGNDAPPDVTIKGTRKRDGTFWPHAIAEVTNELAATWKAIGSTSSRGKTVRLTVAQKGEQERFYVNLDIFRPMIGQMKYGKVVLETGDAAMFELNDLLPPKTDDELKAEQESAERN